MRNEKTMKVIANHIVDPRIELRPNAGSDKSWVWIAYDFAEGELVEEVYPKIIAFGLQVNAYSYFINIDVCTKIWHSRACS
jgi:hypothetical protein